MKKGTVLAFALHICLAAVIYAATTNPTLPPEDTVVFYGVYQNTQIVLYQSCGEIAINGRTHILQATTVSDEFGGFVCLESPTGDFIEVLPDGSAKARIEGQEYQFDF